MRPTLAAAILLAAAGPCFSQADLGKAVGATAAAVKALNERRAAFSGMQELEAAEALAFPGAPPGQPRWHYLTKPLAGAKAVRARLENGWRLDSTGEMKDSAGFFSLRLPGGVLSRPAVDRHKGFSLHFNLAVPVERHAGVHRAGISVIVVSEDLKGVELAFWGNEIWAQRDNPLFTHGEGAAFATTGAVDYELRLSGDRYALSAGGRVVLEGPLKDYSSFGFPYNRPSFLFYGDDTGGAAADMELRSLRVEYGRAAKD